MHLQGVRATGDFKKALYGLRVAPKLWQRHLVKVMTDLGFKQLVNELTMSVKKGQQGKTVCVVVSYVADLLLLGEDRELKML